MRLIGDMTPSQLNEYLQYISKELIRENEEKQEEILFQTWLHKVWDKTYPQFKKEALKLNTKSFRQRNKHEEVMSKEEEQANIEKAERILGRR